MTCPSTAGTTSMIFLSRRGGDVKVPVFVDASAWVGIANPRDKRYRQAEAKYEELLRQGEQLGMVQKKHYGITFSS